jgi:outer membrane protein TolC
MLILGVQNVPLSSMPEGREPMTMRMLGVSQMIPFPGKLPLMSASMRSELDAARHDEETSRRAVVRDVSVAYFDIARADAILALLQRARGLSTELSKASEAYYAAGTGGQAEAIRSRIPLARLAQETAALLEERGAAVARLNALRNRESTAPVATAAIPTMVAAAAVSDSAGHIRFGGLTVGSRAANSPFPSLERLQAIAIDNSATLRAHEAMIAAQRSRTALARKEHLPDMAISVTYSQRAGFPDFISAQIVIPLALRRESRQNEFVAAESADLARLEAEHEVRVNEVRANVSGLVAEAERVRTQLALYKRGILAQAKATRDLAMANYRSGLGDIAAHLDAELMLLELDIEYHRALTDFAKTVAELRFVTGTEVLQ